MKAYTITIRAHKKIADPGETPDLTTLQAALNRRDEDILVLAKIAPGWQGDLYGHYETECYVEATTAAAALTHPTLCALVVQIEGLGYTPDGLEVDGGSELS